MRSLALALALAPLAFASASFAARDPQPRLHLFDVSAEPQHIGSAVDAARDVLLRNAAVLHFDKAALQHLVVDGVHDIGRGGVVVRFRHIEAGLLVWHDAVKVLLTSDLAAVAVGGQLHAVDSAAADGFVVAEADAVVGALGAVFGQKFSAADISWNGVDGAGYHRARTSDARLTLRTLRVQPVLAPLGIGIGISRGGGVEPVVAGYVVEVIGSRARGKGVKGENGDRVAWSIVIDAQSGRVLRRVNLTHDAAFSYRVYADPTDKRPFDGPIGDTMPYPLDAPDGHYPTGVAANLVTTDGFNQFSDPWLADGATTSIGNNVIARSDTDTDGVGDLAATVTAPGVFDHESDINLAAEDNDTQKMATATSLFYVVNWLHDWWYDSGFDEAAHNAQTSNLGRGGVEGDPIDAIGQYGAPQVRDNSAMAVPDDGESPEMEMFVWSGRLSSVVTAGAANFEAFVAEFGPRNFAVTAEAVLTDDGVVGEGTVTDGCEALVTNVTGKIAIIDRGICSFSAKVLGADVAGAVGVIIVNNVAGQGAPFLPVDPAVAASNLPVLSLSLEDGATLKAALLAGAVTTTLDRVEDPDRDGALDTSVAAHEWGHYLHLRQVICQSQQCGAQSEGWGDFIALLTLVREGDDLGGAFPVGAFATGAFPDDPAYFGIRRFPYSTDTNKNPLTLRHIADNAELPTNAPIAVFAAEGTNNAEVHAAGEVWSTLMFESMMAMFAKSQEADAALTFEETRRRVSDIVVKGMQLAPEDPTFTEMRDAIIAAAVSFDVETGGDDANTFGDAFARRGAGTCAVSPERYDDTFNAVVEAFDVQGNIAVTAIAVDDDVVSCDDDGILDAGETGTLRLTVQNLSPQPLPPSVVTLSATSTDLTFAAATIDIGALGAYGRSDVTTQVSLAKLAPSFTHDGITARVSSGPTCLADGLSIAPLQNADDVATGLTTDSVEGSVTTFALAGRFAEFIWTVEPSDVGIAGADWGAGNHYWFGGDAPVDSDTALMTPALQVADNEDFILHLRHRYSFEFDADVNYDGAVIEVSTDDGENWADLKDTVDPGYTGLIGDPQGGRPRNNLDFRDGFVQTNPGHPDLERLTVNLGRAFAGQTVLLRFRIGTDGGGGAEGWEIDDIGFDGIDNAPFAGLIENANACEGTGEGEGEGEVIDETDYRLGGGGCTGCQSSSSEVAAGCVVLAVFARRRRRQQPS